MCISSRLAWQLRPAISLDLPTGQGFRQDGQRSNPAQKACRANMTVLPVVPAEGLQGRKSDLGMRQSVSRSVSQSNCPVVL